MRPRTKIQVRIAGLQAKLPNLTTKQHRWAFKDCLPHKAFRLKSGRTGCLDCGHVWHEECELISLIEIECPKCLTMLKVENTRKTNHTEHTFFAIIDVVEEFQVNRFFEIYKYYTVGKEPREYIKEVVTHWLRPNEKDEVVACLRNGWSGNFGYDAQIRDRRTMHEYNLYAIHTYPEMKFLPIYRRNGFKGKFHGVTPYDMFKGLLNDPKTETLLKAKQYSLLEHRHTRGNKIDRYWKSIKICMRNKFIVKDATSWFDYLALCDYFHIDTLKAENICGKDIHKKHNELVARKRIIDARIEAERAIQREEQRLKDAAYRVEKYEKDKLKYVQDKEAYFDLLFTDEDLKIYVLKSLDEFKEEADAHKHCVHTNRYYSKAHSLILSAQINGIRTETVEVDIDKFRINQSRGLNNNNTEYHDRIVALVEKNMHQIRKVTKQLRKAEEHPLKEFDNLLQEQHAA